MRLLPRVAESGLFAKPFSIDLVFLTQGEVF
jgi:hypothetical protein